MGEEGVLELSAASVASVVSFFPLPSPRPPFLVVVARDRDIEAAVADLPLLSREAGLEGDVLPFPSPGPPVFRNLPRHGDASARRARALAAASHARLLALVASVHALLRPSLTPRLLDTRSHRPGRGRRAHPGDPARGARRGRLPPGGSCHRSRARWRCAVESSTSFRRTAIVPVRLEFFGETIESLAGVRPRVASGRCATLDAPRHPSPLRPRSHTLPPPRPAPHPRTSASPGVATYPFSFPPSTAASGPRRPPISSRSSRARRSRRGSTSTR